MKGNAINAIKRLQKIHIILERLYNGDLLLAGRWVHENWRPHSSSYGGSGYYRRIIRFALSNLEDVRSSLSCHGKSEQEEKNADAEGELLPAAERVSRHQRGIGCAQQGPEEAGLPFRRLDDPEQARKNIKNY